MPRTLARALLGAFLCLCALAPRPAVAHAVLVESRPGDGERLDRPPAELVLRFSEPVAPVAVRLLDSRGAEVPGIALEPRGETLAVRPAGPLPEGAYLLSYRVTSVDGHPVGATLRFGIGVDPTAAIDDAALGTAGRWPGLAARLLVYVTALGAAGLALFVHLVRPPEPVRGRVRRLLRPLATAGIGAVLLRLGVGGLELAGLPLAALATAGPWAAVAGTSLALATAVAVVGLTLLILPGRAVPWAGSAGAAVVAGSFALTGHAAGAEPRWLTTLAVAVHALCGAFWLGSLAPLLWGLRLPAAETVAVLRRFSAAASGAVALLVTAGACLAWVQLGGELRPLWGTDYGLRLAGKLALVAGLLGLAAVNRLVLTPRAARGDVRALRRSLKADMALGLGVLAATASLPLGPPPRATAAAGSAAWASGVTIVAATSGGQQAALTLVPGRPGMNRLAAWVTDAAGAPVAAREASVRVSLPAAGIEPARSRAAAPRPGAYVAEGLAMPQPGRWRLRLELLVDDFTKITFEGEVAVGEGRGHGHPRDHRTREADGATEEE